MTKCDRLIIMNMSELEYFKQKVQKIPEEKSNSTLIQVGE